MKKLTRLLVGFSVLAVLMVCMTAVSFAGTANDKAKVYVSSAMAGQFDCLGWEVEATGDLFEKYYPDMAANDAAEGVSFADALVAAHIKRYGEDKVTENLAFGGKDWMSKHFGRTSVGLYFINNESLPTGVNSDTVKDGDRLFAFTYSGDTWNDLYAYFDKESVKVKVGEEVELKLTAFNFGADVIPADAKAVEVDMVEGTCKEIAGSSYENGVLKMKFDKADTYIVSAEGTVKYAGWDGSEVEGKIAGPLAVIEVEDVTPAKPVIKSAKRTAKTKAVVTWKKAKNAKKYEVAYRKAGAKKWTTKLTKSTKVTLKKLAAKKKYQVKVRAINGTAKSKYSKAKTIKIKK